MKKIYLIFFGFSFFLQIFFYIEQEYKIQFLLFEITYIFIIIFLIRINYLMSPISLFVLITFFYLSAGPLDIHFFVNYSHLNPEKLSLLLLFGYAFIYLLVVLWTVFNNRTINIHFLSKVDYSIRRTTYGKNLYNVIVTLLVLTLIFYIGSFAMMNGISIGGKTRGEIFSNSSFLNSMSNILLPLLGITAIWLNRNYIHNKDIKHYIVLLSLVLFVLFDLIVKGDRRELLAMLLSIGGIIYYHKDLPKKYIILGMFASIFLYFLGAIRNRPISAWADGLNYFITRDFSPVQTEFGPFSVVANFLFNDDFFMSSPTMFSSALSTIPSFLYPEKPLASSIWFVKTYFEDYYNSGGGYAFNIIVDATLNFGYFAPLILALFYFTLFTLAKQKGSIAILLSSLLINSFIFSARFDFTSLYQTIIYGWVMLFFIFFFTFFRRTSHLKQ